MKRPIKPAAPPPFLSRSLREPKPLWPDAPRYCPERDLPPYRFVAGLNPHPLRHPDGHSRDRPETEAPALPPEGWRENRAYLQGIDLYHQGYFWEAHEAWEALWKQEDRHSAVGQFLQGLILLSAARIKLNVGSGPGVRKTSLLGYLRLKAVLDMGVCSGRGRFMGLDLVDLLARIERHYGPLWPDGSMRGVVLRGDPPTLPLAF